MRIAAIDIGTNSVHIIVVQIRPDFSFEIIDREKNGAGWLWRPGGSVVNQCRNVSGPAGIS